MLRMNFYGSDRIFRVGMQEPCGVLRFKVISRGIYLRFVADPRCSRIQRFHPLEVSNLSMHTMFADKYRAPDSILYPREFC